MTTAILILAAGASSRMGKRDKLLLEVSGEPLLRRIVRRALASGMPVGVALPVPGVARRAALEGLDHKEIDVSDAAQGMAASIRAGVWGLQSAGAIMITPADMPELETGDFLALANAFKPNTAQEIVRATDENGRPGHPVLFPGDFFPELLKITGDRGARPLIERHKARVRDVPLKGRRALLDIDTPSDWDDWQQGG